MSKTSTYWDKRAIDRLSDAEKTSQVYVKRIKKIYDRAYQNIEKELESVYRNYAKEVGLDVQKLKQKLSKSETNLFWKALSKKGLNKYIKNNYKARISRLEQIQAQIYAQAKDVYLKEELEQTMCYRGVINRSYTKAIYDTQRGTGYNFSFNKIDKNTTNILLNEKWSSKNYSQRIWENTDILADSISEIVGGALLSGQGIEKTAKQIRNRFHVSKYYAERLVRTETNHFNNEADAMAYEEMGINKYVFVATLDNRTSEICQSHDGKIYDYENKKVGVNFPPLHPNCRSKTRGYVGEDAERQLKRRARNPITGKTEVINNIPYNEWIKQYGVTSTKKGIFISNQNVTYDTNSFRILDKHLIKTNSNQLEHLLNKYPKVKNFIKEKGLLFDAKTTEQGVMAYTSHTRSMERLGIHLSNDSYKDSRKYYSTIKSSIKSGEFMPCSNDNIDKYVLNHEFGHLIENYLINEYNINNPIEYKEARKQSISAYLRYENEICDNISQEIYNIALKNNKDFKLDENLSKYGKESSQEFFAECFANMISGKPNELGKAMEEYLKGVM